MGHRRCYDVTKQMAPPGASCRKLLGSSLTTRPALRRWGVWTEKRPPPLEHWADPGTKRELCSRWGLEALWADVGAARC